MEIQAYNTIDAWKECLRKIIENGRKFIDQDKRTCIEIMNLTIVIEHPDLDIEKPIDTMQDFDLIYPTKDELTTIILNKENTAAYEYSYGPRIFDFQKQKNQVEGYVIPLLKKDPETRRAIISLYNPINDSNPLYKNIPSLLIIYFRIENNRLDCSCTIRSNDFVIGWPGNIYQISILQKYVADKLNMRTGTLTTTSFSAHVFEDNKEMINKILNNKRK